MNSCPVFSAWFKGGVASRIMLQMRSRFFTCFAVVALVISACSNATTSNDAVEEAIEAGEELAVTSESAALTRDQLVNLAMALAVGENFDGEQITVDDDLLRTLATIHIRSTAIVNFLEDQDDESFNLDLLVEQAVEGATQLIETGQANELAPDSAEFAALTNIILADRTSNPLRAERDPTTGQSVVGDNPFTSSFVFDPNLAPNFNTVSPGFLEQFDETFAEFTAGTSVATNLGMWNSDSFLVEAP